MTDFIFDGPAKAPTTVLLAHGAGAPMDSASMTAATKALVAEGFRVARAYMIRLEGEDFEHAAWVDRLAEAAHLSPGVFRQRFEYLGASAAVSAVS